MVIHEPIKKFKTVALLLLGKNSVGLVVVVAPGGTRDIGGGGGGPRGPRGARGGGGGGKKGKRRGRRENKKKKTKKNNRKKKANEWG